MRAGKLLIAAIAFVIGAGAGAFGNELVSTSRSTSPNDGYGSTSGGLGMMGTQDGGSSSMMGGTGGVGVGAVRGLIPATRMNDLAVIAARATHRHGSTITYDSRDVTLVALGAPGNRPGMYWQIDGVDHPTVSVPAGSTVTVEFADGDPGRSHGFELIAAPPPYPKMAMMEGRIAAVGAFIMPVPAPYGDLWYATTVNFRAPPAGNYYIICPVPGHAMQGMWSKFVVR